MLRKDEGQRRKKDPERGKVDEGGSLIRGNLRKGKGTGKRKVEEGGRSRKKEGQRRRNVEEGGTLRKEEC